MIDAVAFRRATHNYPSEHLRLYSKLYLHSLNDINHAPLTDIGENDAELKARLEKTFVSPRVSSNRKSTMKAKRASILPMMGAS